MFDPRQPQILTQPFAFFVKELRPRLTGNLVAAALGKVTPHDLRRSFCSLALDVFTRHYAGDYGKAQRDEARARMLAAGFGESVSTAVSTEAASGETGTTESYAKTWVFAATSS